MNTKIIAAVIGALIIIGAGWWLLGRGSAPAGAPSGQPYGQETSVPTGGASGSVAAASTTSYTLAQVAIHNGATSCWTAINGKVYDATSWIDKHPGGRQAILSLCGTDGSAAFNGQHGGQRRPADELKQLYIGELAQ